MPAKPVRVVYSAAGKLLLYRKEEQNMVERDIQVLRWDGSTLTEREP